ncbi:transposase [Methyloprofundus sedimenti]|uniref:Transposase n=1 Tax=Methyloprofundus sedimenti TaxID=1420851 RepID=A0A1V8M6N5_9GAMM|nr:transposase [Methyloprofundus sedimenti]OQK17205.1 transposase [Methyloprofundus sedimenti]
MGKSRYTITEQSSPHFLTNTIVNWIPMFTRPAAVQIILDSFCYLQQNADLKLYGYVIMENHLHWIAQSHQLIKDVQRFKSFTARGLIDHLSATGEQTLLQQLAFYKKAHKQDRDYQVWEEGSHPQLIQNAAILRQKLEYMHLNPVKRGYVDLAEHWRYSSARNYADQSGLIEVYRDW